MSDRNFYNDFRSYCKHAFPGKEGPLGILRLEWNKDDGYQEGATTLYSSIALDQFCRNINLDYRLATHEDYEKLSECLGWVRNDLRISPPHSLVLFSLDDSKIGKGDAARLFGQIKGKYPQYSSLVLRRDKKYKDKLAGPVLISLRGLSMDKQLMISMTDETVVCSLPGYKIADHFVDDHRGIWVAHKSKSATSTDVKDTVFEWPGALCTNQEFILVKPGSLTE